MSWSSNNTAHAALYSFEKWDHDVSGISFKKAGEWSTDYLIGFAAGGSAKDRKNKVEAHARKLDQVFTALFHATYEDDFDRAKAVRAMEEVLSDSEKIMGDLGEIADNAYKFRGEF